jgi:hypothetical protein
MPIAPDRRRQHRLRALFKDHDERIVRVERIVSLLIEKGVLDRRELAAEGLLEPPHSGAASER